MTWFDITKIRLLILFREIFTVHSAVYTAPIHPPGEPMRVQISLGYIVQILNVDLAENTHALHDYYPVKLAAASESLDTKLNSFSFKLGASNVTSEMILISLYVGKL
jgi:hypothetical protein